MRLVGTFLGRTIRTLELEVRPEEIAVGTIDRTIKGVTRWWTGRMFR